MKTPRHPNPLPGEANFHRALVRFGLDSRDQARVMDMFRTALQASPIMQLAAEAETMRATISRLHSAAWDDMNVVSEALGVDPDGGVEHIVESIRKLRAVVEPSQPAATAIAKDRTVHLVGCPAVNSLPGCTCASRTPAPATPDEQALIGIAKRLGEQCTAWEGIGARDVEQVLRYVDEWRAKC